MENDIWKMSLVLASNPSLRRMLKAFATRKREALRSRLPLEALNRDIWSVDAHHVEGIFFTAAASGSGGPRLHDERRVPFDFVARGAVRCVADVKVAGKKEIGALISQDFPSHTGQPH